MAERARIALKGVSAGYGETVVLEDINLDARARREHQRDRPQRRRQDHAAGHHHGPHHPAQGRGAARRPQPQPRAGAIAAPRPASASCRRSARFSLAQRAGESRRRRAAGPLDAGAACSSCSRNLKERLDNRGNQLSGGEQQMLSIARALLTNPTRAADGRADRGARAGDRRGADRGADQAAQRQRAVDHPGRTEQPRRVRVLRRAAWCSTRAASSMTARRRALRDDPERLAKLIGIVE